MFSAIRKLRSILIAFLFALGCGGSGVRELVERAVWEPATARPCGDVASLRPGDRVTLTDCEGVPALAVFEAVRGRRGRRGRVLGAELPIRARGNRGAPTLVLATQSTDVVQRLTVLAAAAPDDEHTDVRVQAFLEPLPLDPINAEVDDAAPARVRARLGDGVLHLREVDPTPPSVPGALLFIALGLFWALVCFVRVQSLVSPSEPTDAAVA